MPNLYCYKCTVASRAAINFHNTHHHKQQQANSGQSRIGHENTSVIVSDIRLSIHADIG